jgi:transcriptional regulator with XRE-family HTH domain
MSPDNGSESVSEAELRYRRLLEEHARSGLTQIAFAEGKGISSSTLSWWRREVQHRDRRRAKLNGAAPRLVPVEVVGEHRAGPAFVVQLTSGRILRVRGGFDAAELKRLVEVLEAC